MFFVMLSEKRRIQIKDIIKNKERVSTEKLQEMFKVSRMTIWRDLSILEEKGEIIRVYGGAIINDRGDPHEKEFKIRTNWSSKEKEIIAQYAVENYINDNNIICLDGGTTVIRMIPYITQNGITLITNGLNTLFLASKYSSKIKVISSGGVLRHPSFNFVGPDAQKSVEDYHIDTAFISGTGFTIEQGIMDPHPLEMEIKKKMCKKANKIIALIDSSKFNKTSLSTFLPVDQIDVLITDDKAPKDMIKKIRSKNVKVDVIL